MKYKDEYPLTGYRKFVVFILAITKFTVILDFMIISPLGDMLMKSLFLKPSTFGVAVSGYAINAGISGLFTAAIADKYDRKGTPYSFSESLVALSDMRAGLQKIVILRSTIYPG